MSREPMMENICGQPASHRGIIERYAGEQHPLLSACAEQIRKCPGRIIFSGMGASLFAALPAVSRLEQHGYSAQAIESAELLHYSMAAVRPGDVCVLISRSGGSIEVLRLAERLGTLGVTVLGVTNVAETKLARAADLCLQIGAEADQLIAVQTYTGTVLALLLLVEEVLTGESVRLGSACRETLPALAQVIDQSLQASHSWQSFLDAPGPLFLLGRGPALASVHEGALLMHETAKAPAIGMSCGQFRHGPVEVVSTAFRAVIFATPSRTRTVDRALAADLLRMGGQVRWIGPDAQSSEESGPLEALIPWPVADASLPPAFAEVLAPLFEIVPLQVAAYHLAVWRGITPGDFRYASEVTSEESGFPLLQQRLARP